MSKIGFGIVGCGMIAGIHARAIGELREASLIGCHSRNPANTSRFAEEHACQAFDRLEQLLSDPRIQVVCVCTPSGAHAEPALAAIAAGKHVIIEKPLEVTLRRCDMILTAAADAGVVVSTVFQSRFHDAMATLRRAVTQGRFGTITLADAFVKWYRPQAYYDRHAWRGTWTLDGGGALMNQAIHSVDLLLWILGPVVSVTAQAATLAHERIDVEDTLVATLQFQRGALGVIEATTGSFPGSLKRIEIRGSTGTAVVEEENLIEWNFTRRRASDDDIVGALRKKTKSGGGAADPAAIGNHGHAAQFRDVLRAIRTGKPPLIDGAQSRASVELVVALYAAARSGHTVHLPLKRDPK